MNQRRNDYLRELETRLHSLPHTDREQEITEVTQHLDNLIRAHQAEGQTEDAATQNAIAQFGTARDIGGQLYQTGKHKRFGPLAEVALFCAGFYTVLNIIWWAALWVLWRCQMITPPRVFVEAMHAHTPLPLTWYLRWPVPFSWYIGLAAIIAVAVRYGKNGRGVFQKMNEPISPLGAALWWILVVFLIDTPLPKLGTVLFGDLSPKLSHPAALTLIVGSYAFWLFAAWGAAFWVGRRGKSRESVADASVADAVAIAAAIGPVMSLFQMTVYQVVPMVPGNAATVFFLNTLPSYLTNITICLIYGVFRVFVAWLGVQMGENSRRLPNRTKQAA